MVDLSIRLAVPDDSDELRNIYAAYIDKPVTFEESLPSPLAFRKRVEDILAVYPYFVVEREGHLFGYACARRQAERAAYAWNVELSIYLCNEVCGLGLGSILYEALIPVLKLQGIKSAYGLVTVPNEASQHLHEKFGFHLMGLQRFAGYSCGAWRDVAWYTLSLGSYDENPAPILTFPALYQKKPERVNDIISKAKGALQERSERQTTAAEHHPADSFNQPY